MTDTFAFLTSFPKNFRPQLILLYRTVTVRLSDTLPEIPGSDLSADCVIRSVNLKPSCTRTVRGFPSHYNALSLHENSVQY